MTGLHTTNELSCSLDGLSPHINVFQSLETGAFRYMHYLRPSLLPFSTVDSNYKTNNNYDNATTNNK